MAPKNPAKPKRHKKRKSRTEVSSDSESEPEPKQVKKASSSSNKNERESSEESEPRIAAQNGKEKSKHMTDAEVSSEFTKFYLARATKEFEDDLDKLRSTTDFRDEHLGILVDALKQGTSLFGTEEKRKIVLAGKGE